MCAPCSALLALVPMYLQLRMPADLLCSQRRCSFCPAAVPEHVTRHQAKLAKIKGILSGHTPISMLLEFLYRCGCGCVCVCVRARASTHTCACLRACVCAHAWNGRGLVSGTSPLGWTARCGGAARSCCCPWGGGGGQRGPRKSAQNKQDWLSLSCLHAAAGFAAQAQPRGPAGP